MNIKFPTFKAIEDEILAKVDSSVVNEYCATGGLLKGSASFGVSGLCRFYLIVPSSLLDFQRTDNSRFGTTLLLICFSFSASAAL